MTKCIAVLTRGYKDLERYESLIKRNKHVSNNLEDKSIDNLIFHEGNITEEQQTYIKNETPELNIKFINISTIAFKIDKENIQIEEAERFGLGYRHMCSFWFVNFFDAVTNYDKLLRIDEDCFVDSNIDNMFLQLTQFILVCGKTTTDCEFVTKGLNNFTQDFLNKYKKNFSFKTILPKPPYGPYTNLCGFSLDKIRNNDAFQQYKEEIDKSDMIYKRRWGDLPLWGEAMYYFFGNNTLKIDSTIKYFHGSHNKHVN